MSKISFLFGSGISLYSGFDNLGTITETVLNSKNYARSTDMFYYHYRAEVECDYVSSIQKLLNYLNGIISNYQERIDIEPYSNYETIYYLIAQISDSEIQEYENPALYLLILEIEEEFEEEIKFHKNSLREYCEEARTYITHVVFNCLNKAISETKQLDILFKIEEKKPDYTFDIFSLNHDLIIEKFFETNNKNLNYGFEESKNIHVFKPSLFEQNEKYNLIKLHGSIDWFSFSDGKNNTDIFKVPLDNNLPIDRYYEIDDRLVLGDILPKFLIGSFNKLNSYLGGLYEIFYDLLKKRIDNAEFLIISGYSFGDKGINTRITQFLSSSESKKLIIVHPDKESLKSNARGSFHINILPNSKTEIIEKKFEELTIEELTF